MARKRPLHGRNAHKRPPSRHGQMDSPPGPMDHRVLERSLLDIVGGPVTPLRRAQERMYDAFAAPDPRRRVELAQEALALSGDCADAYVLLAEHAPNRKAALELYEQGVVAGVRAVGERTFREQAGRFWGLFHTRPYMRARLGLALELWTSGKHQEAVEHARELLRLNPNDNQGVRYTLAGWLLDSDRDEELERLLAQYPDEATAAWAYTRALLAFRKSGDTPEARSLLQEARRQNEYVPDYLTGQKFPPEAEPGPYTLGDESEALNFLRNFLTGWRNTPGAVAWLRGILRSERQKPEEPPRGPLGMVKNWLKKRLPQTDDVWQADARPLPDWVQIAGEKLRLWMALVMSRSRDLILGHDLLQERPTPARIWDVLVQAMQNPVAGEPHRPAELQVPGGEMWESLRPHLDEIGVRLVTAQKLDMADAVFPEAMGRAVPDPRPGILDIPGVSPAQVASLHEAAADFFAAAPWRSVGWESAVRIDCDRFRRSPWFATVMGQSGLTRGVALYDSMGAIRALWRGSEEGLAEAVGLSVQFAEETEIAAVDADATREHGWRLARPDAYPLVLCTEFVRGVRQPEAWELEVCEACLRALPGFAGRKAADDPTPEEVTVRLASGEAKLVLAWVVSE